MEPSADELKLIRQGDQVLKMLSIKPNEYVGACMRAVLQPPSEPERQGPYIALLNLVVEMIRDDIEIANSIGIKTFDIHAENGEDITHVSITLPYVNSIQEGN